MKCVTCTSCIYATQEMAVLNWYPLKGGIAYIYAEIWPGCSNFSSPYDITIIAMHMLDQYVISLKALFECYLNKI